jgi:hypothetical protein
VGPGRDDGPSASPATFGPCPAARISPVTRHRGGAQAPPAPTGPPDGTAVEQRRENPLAVGLAGREQKPERPAHPVASQMQLGAEAPARAAKAFCLPPPLAPAAC